MNFDTARSYLLDKPEARLDFPFGPRVLVFKISKKMFATLGLNGDLANMNLKCDPQEAIMLRDVFDAVIPGYHMNKDHWNTLILDGSIPVAEIERMIDRSFGLVVRGLPKSDRGRLEMLYGSAVLYR